MTATRAERRRDARAIASMREQVARHAAAQGMKLADTGVRLEAVDGTEEAALYLRHRSEWATLLGCGQVAVLVRAPPA